MKQLKTVFVILTFLITASCGSGSGKMSKEEFTQAYMDALKKAHPKKVFTLQPDVSILCKYDDKEFSIYPDNAYSTYEMEPDSITPIFNQYIASVTELFAVQEDTIVLLDRVVPVIKPKDFLAHVKSLVRNADTSQMQVYEPYSDELVIVYAEDKANNISYFTWERFEYMNISLDTLRAAAIRNLGNAVTIEKRGEKGTYMITAGGNYEATLILLSDIWTKENFDVKGDIVIGIPNRDILFVTGSKDKEGIAKITGMISDSYKTGNYQVSENLYKWNGKKFEKYAP